MAYYEGVEQESYILEYRRLHGLNTTELARRIGSSNMQITYLAVGIESPYTERGKLKSCADKLCKYFNVTVAELFPRYACTFSHEEAKFQLESIMWETWSETVSSATYAEDQLFINEIKSLLTSRFRQRDVDIFISHIFNNTPLWDLGSRYNLTGATMGMVVHKCLNWLRGREDFKHGIDVYRSRL